MKASICLLLGVAVFSTLFLESSTASTEGGGLLGGVLGSVGNLTGNLLEGLKKLLSQLIGTATTTVDKATGLLTDVLNGVGTVVQNTNGTANDAATEIQTILGNVLDTLAKIVPAITSGTTESLGGASALITTIVDSIKQIDDILATNPEVASALNNVSASLKTVQEILGSLKENVDDMVKLQVSV